MKPVTTIGISVLLAFFLAVGLCYAHDTAERFLTEGMEYATQGKFKEAKKKFERALMANPYATFANEGLELIEDMDQQKIKTDTAIHFYKGVAYSLKKNFADAIVQFNKAIEKNPKFALAYNNRGKVYRRKGQYDQAISDHSKAIELNPRYVMAYISRGLTYRRTRQLAEAISDYNKAIKLNPRYAVSYRYRGDAYGSKGQYDKAISDYTKVIEINPKHADAYFRRAVIYAKHKGQYDKAISDYSKIIETSPRDVDAYFMRAIIYAKYKGQYDKAISDYTKVIEINPTYSLIFFARGNAFSVMGQYDKAISDYSRAIEISPKYVDAFFNRGTIYAKHKGQYDKGISDFNKAIEINPRYTKAYLARGVAWRMKGDLGRALADFKEALRLMPDNEKLRRTIARLQAEKRELLKRGQKSPPEVIDLGRKAESKLRKERLRKTGRVPSSKIISSDAREETKAEKRRLTQETILIYASLLNSAALFGVILWFISVLVQKQSLKLPERPLSSKILKLVAASEFLRIVVCFFVAFLLYDFLRDHVQVVGIGSKGFLAYLTTAIYKSIVEIAFPSFLAILIALFFVSWRFKLIAGTLILYVIIGERIVELISSSQNIRTLLQSSIGLSFGLLGALGAIYAWRQRVHEKAKYAHLKPIKQRGKPRLSIILLLLSLLSIPATYISVIISASVTFTLSTIVIPFLLILLRFLPGVAGTIFVAAIVGPFIAGSALIKALWEMCIPKPTFEPAVLVNPANYTTLNDIVVEVCEKVGTKEPDFVILHAEPHFFVMSGKLDTYDGFVRGRILALGAPLIKELNCSEIKSILAHEFAHFSGRDTLYSTMVAPVYRGLISSMQSLTVRGNLDDEWVFKAVGLLLLTSKSFLRAFLEYFATIDRLLLRNRELRADWIAATFYGTEIFSTALRKVVRVGRHFAENALETALHSGDYFFDAYSKSLMDDKLKLQTYEEKALSEREREFDFHPSLSTRLTVLLEVSDKWPDSLATEAGSNLDLSDIEKRLAKKYIQQLMLTEAMREQYLREVRRRNI